MVAPFNQLSTFREQLNGALSSGSFLDWKTLDQRLVGWNDRSVLVMNQAGVLTEKVWFNVESDREVHWSTMAGRNFTDRQRIKRKAANWSRRYWELPPAGRVAVLGAIMAVET